MAQDKDKASNRTIKQITSKIKITLVTSIPRTQDRRKTVSEEVKSKDI